ncbi:MAG: DHH family phosphoesterase [Aggregatilineales bacterium]
MTPDTPNWPGAARAIDAAASILLVTHVNPDGDAIGSLLGLAAALRERGCRVDTAVDGGVPNFLAFLTGADSVCDALSAGEWDLMISLDASDEARTGQAGAYGRAHSRAVINVDHHPTNTFFGDIFLVLPEAVSTTEVLFHLLDHMRQPLSVEAATALLTGLATDTLGFRTNNVTAATLRIAIALMEAGAPLHEVIARTLNNKSYKMLLLWQRALASMTLHEQVIAASISQEDLRSTGLTNTADAGLSSFLVSVREAVIAVVFKELEDGRVELSMRSKPGYDVASVALGLGGGGHVQAAGATIDGPLPAARARVLALLQRAAQSGSAGAHPAETPLA